MDTSTKAFVLDPESVVEDRHLAIILSAMERRVSAKLKITESPTTNNRIVENLHDDEGAGNKHHMINLISKF